MPGRPEPHPPFEVTVQRDDAALATVTVGGELDLATVPELSAAVAQHCDARLVVLDLTAVTFMDSTGVLTLIQADRRCADSQSRLVVLAGNGPVRRVLDLCELDGQLTLVSDHPSRTARRIGLASPDP
jgi:anti-sigma B factor antagonist